MVVRGWVVAIVTLLLQLSKIRLVPVLLKHVRFPLISCTVEPRYNEVLRTMKITLYQGKKTKKYKELGPAKLPCYKRVLLYPTSL